MIIRRFYALVLAFFIILSPLSYFFEIDSYASLTLPSIGDIINIDGNRPGSINNLNIIDLNGFLSHTLDVGVDLLGTGLGYVYNHVINDNYCPKSDNHRHKFEYGYTRKNGIDGYFSYCVYCGQFSGDLVSNEVKELDIGNVSDSVEWIGPESFVLRTKQGSNGITGGTVYKNQEGSVSISYISISKYSWYDDQLVIEISNGNNYGLGIYPNGKSGYTLNVGEYMPIPWKLSDVNGFGGGYFTGTETGNISTNPFSVSMFSPRISIPSRPCIVKIDLSQYKCLYKVINIWDSRFTGSSYTNINGNLVYYDNDVYKYAGNNNNILDISSNKYTFPGDTSITYNSYDYDFSRKTYSIEYDGGSADISYTDDGVYIVQKKNIYENDVYVGDEIEKSIQLYFVADLSNNEHEVTISPTIDNDGNPIINPDNNNNGSGIIDISGSVVFDVNQRSSESNSYIITHEDIPNGIVNLREKLASMFTALPDMFGDFAVFMTTGFSYIPEEIRTLLLFGVTTSVFVGLFKMFWR